MKAQYEFLSLEEYKNYLRTYFAIQILQGSFLEYGAASEVYVGHALATADKLINKLNIT